MINRLVYITNGECLDNIELTQFDLAYHWLNQIKTYCTFENVKVPISLYFDEFSFSELKNISNNENKINDIIRTFFHPNYNTINFKPIIFLSEKIKLSERKTFNLLTQYALDQGYLGIEYILIKSPGPNPENLIVENNSITDLEYFDLLTTQYYSSNYILSKNITLLETLKSVEDNLSKSHPILHQKLIKFGWLLDQQEKNQELFKKLKSDLENQTTYLKLIKEQDETKNILNFYFHEYEILPLWFKRLGHLIKVLMGKRTFRSLYNSDVKKYNT